MLLRAGHTFGRLAAPGLCLAMLSFVWAGQRGQLDAEDFEPYHAEVREAVSAIPSDVGPWVGKNVEVPESALYLLRPNALRNIRYRNIGLDQGRLSSSDVFLTLVQCQRTRDMLGHYPPNCYQAYGDTLAGQRQRNWTLSNPDGRSHRIDGMEYTFERNVRGTLFRRIVYNFMVVPTRGIVADMDDLQQAAEKQGQRYYGAAQVQVVFVSVAGQEADAQQRDDVFIDLVSAAWPAIQTIESGIRSSPAGAEQQ